MAKRVVNVGKITDKDGKDFDPNARSAGSGSSFKLIPPDYYFANVQSIKENTDDWRKFSVNGKVLENKKHKEGKWNYWTVTPNFVLINENKTIINRQNFQIGVLDDGALIRPDGDSSKPVLWAEGQFLLGALGVLHKSEYGEFSIDFDPDLIQNRIVKVKTGIGGYIKGGRGFNHDEMHNLLLEQNDGEEYEFEDIPALIAMYNDDNERTDEADNKLKAKNLVLSVFPVDQKTINENGYFLDEATGAVFVTELDYDKYLQLLDASESYQEPDL